MRRVFLAKRILLIGLCLSGLALHLVNQPLARASSSTWDNATDGFVRKASRIELDAPASGGAGQESIPTPTAMLEGPPDNPQGYPLLEETSPAYPVASGWTFLLLWFGGAVILGGLIALTYALSQRRQ